jgi:hypothetical protein
MPLSTRHANRANVNPIESDPRVLAIVLLGLGDITKAEAAALAGLTPAGFDALLTDETVVSRAEQEAIRLSTSDDLALLRARRVLVDVLGHLQARVRDDASVITPSELTKIASMAETISGLTQRRGAELRFDLEAASSAPFATSLRIENFRRPGKPLRVLLESGE